MRYRRVSFELCVYVITVVQEMYWYIAKDEKGLKGMVPGNFLKPLEGTIHSQVIQDTCICVDTMHFLTSTIFYSVQTTHLILFS